MEEPAGQHCKDSYVKQHSKETKTSSHVVVHSKSEEVVEDEPEIINALELMKDLENEITVSEVVKMTPKFENVGDRNASNFFKRVSSPKRNEGKEKKPRHYGFHGCARRLEYTPQEEVLKPLNMSESWNNVTPTLSKRTSCDVKTESSRRNSRLSVPKQSPNPLFDPKLSAFYGEELVEEGEWIKNLASPNIRTYKAEGS
ncbi:hypothetical protein IFM89_031404 [Coptis chinensis]|uniref:Uncharacterized protein n=1 Tax=Coptis chinensis TaxID=261450 RepID=A0A835LTA8_9MAGN|nr:hypothetical protein IFM89_031404 [Coptis chinensis]